MLDRLLTVEEAAERLGTSTRFVRRLVAERRIAYVKVGRHVRLDRPMWRRSSPPGESRSDHHQWPCSPTDAPVVLPRLVGW